jgi:hypothetical protein
MKQILKVVEILALIIFFCFTFTCEVFAQVVINEFVPDSITEWIELYNASSSADYIKNYYLDDDADFENDIGSKKKLLTSLNTINPTFPYIETSSFLNNSGDWVVLFDQDGNILDQFQYTSNPGKDVSMGRYPDNSGNFSILAYSTKADGNAVPPTPTPTEVPQPTQTPTLTPTPTPTSTFTPIPTKTSTPTPTKTPTPTPTKKPDPTESPVILGIEDDPSTTPSSINSDITEPQKKSSILAIVFIGLGLILICFSVGYTIRKTNKDEK